MLKNCLEIDNYNAALHWYSCTHVVYSLFNDIYNSKCALAAVLLPSQLPSLLPLFISMYTEINSATETWQLIGNYAILAKNNQSASDMKMVH